MFEHVLELVLCEVAQGFPGHFNEDVGRDPGAQVVCGCVIVIQCSP